MNPNEQGTPAWTTPTGILGAPQDGSQGCSFLQSPLFWLIAAGVVIYMMSQPDTKKDLLEDED